MARKQRLAWLASQDLGGSAIDFQHTLQRAVREHTNNVHVCIEYGQ